jgi:hypothetical protein
MEMPWSSCGFFVSEVLAEEVSAFGSLGRSWKLGEVLHFLEVRGAEVLLEVVVEELLLLTLAPVEVSKSTDGTSRLMPEVLPPIDIVVVVSHIGKVGLSGDDRDLREPIIEGVERLALKRSLEIVSDDMNLGEAGPKGFGRREVANITQTEDVLVLLVSESLVVNIEQAIRG